MLPGPTIIRRCAACAQPFKQETLFSGNTFGATFWTDGLMDAPMLPESHALIRCPHCQALLWIKEQNILGEIDWGDRNVYPQARDYIVPTFKDYWALLESGDYPPEQERYLRLHVWWIGNQPRRKNVAPAPLTASEVTNLRHLAALANDADEEDQVMKAEILRELGEFAEALALLEKPFKNPELLQSSFIIRDLARAGDAAVREITTERYLTGTEQYADELITSMRRAATTMAADFPLGEETAFQQFDVAKTEVKQRKYRYLQTLQPEERFALTQRHPLWIIDYDLAIAAIESFRYTGLNPASCHTVACQLDETAQTYLLGYYLCGGVNLSIHDYRVPEYWHREYPAFQELRELQRARWERGDPPLSGFFREGSIREGWRWAFSGDAWYFTCDGELQINFGEKEDAARLFSERIEICHWMMG